MTTAPLADDDESRARVWRGLIVLLFFFSFCCRDVGFVFVACVVHTFVHRVETGVLFEALDVRGESIRQFSDSRS